MSPALLGLAIFALALGPRLVGLQQDVTADEPDWIMYAVRFQRALATGDLRGTLVIQHPAVPLLWLGTLAVGPERATNLATLRDREQTAKDPAFLGSLRDARTAMALVSAAFTVGLALLTWRLFGSGPGLLAGLLLAAEPFLVAHGRLFQPDPLLAQLMAVSVLAALIAFARPGVSPYLLVSGVATGLACLTKLPAAFLIGFIPLLGLLTTRGRAGALDRGMARLAGRLLVWALAAAVTYLLAWPALWVDPLGTIATMLRKSSSSTGNSFTAGSFFLGAPVEDPGPLFYPLATLMRLSPVTLAGLVPLVLGTVRARRATWRPALAGLVVFVILFTAVMTLASRKADRYLLPAYPPLVILAALGLWRALEAAPSFRREPAADGAGRRWAGLGLATLGLAQAALLRTVQPYPLSFYDPLLGGIGLARQTLPVGWGEGLDQVAAYLNKRPAASHLVVTTHYNAALQAQFAGTAVPLREWQRADYVVDYVSTEQRRLLPTSLAAAIRTEPPLFTARVQGQDYARLYRIPPNLRH